MRNPFLFFSLALTLTLSLGLSSCSGQSDTKAQTKNKADQAPVEGEYPWQISARVNQLAFDFDAVKFHPSLGNDMFEVQYTDEGARYFWRAADYEGKPYGREFDLKEMPDVIREALKLHEVQSSNVLVAVVAADKRVKYRDVAPIMEAMGTLDRNKMWFQVAVPTKVEADVIPVRTMYFIPLPEPFLQAKFEAGRLPFGPEEIVVERDRSKMTREEKDFADGKINIKGELPPPTMDESEVPPPPPPAVGKSEMPPPPPTSAPAYPQPSPDLELVEVRLNAKQQLEMDGKTVGLSQAVPALEERFVDGSMAAIVTADPEARWEHVVQMWSALSMAKVQKYTFYYPLQEEYVRGLESEKDGE
ncbi:MAG: hypothetical protein AAF570_07020 [Bacteroidota bacterium]